jgi:hypothetical protein
MGADLNEMSIKLFMARNLRDSIRRKEGEEYHTDCINYRNRAQGIGIMFWSEFKKGKIGPEYF